MKIIQVCLCGSYNPKMGYQDNILPKYYVKLGFECITITSQYYTESGVVKRSTKKIVTLSDKIKLIRIPNKYGLSYKANRFLRLYTGLYKILLEEKPDIIFLHNFQFLSIRDVVRYCKKNNNVKVYVDSHTDFINSATNWLSMNILHKVIWRHCAKLIEPFTIKFWGVTEQRCKFLNEVYRIPEEKIDLLVMGADDEQINFSRQDEIRRCIRKELSISNDDFVIITGGKIDRKKNIHLLIDAINVIANDKLKLVIFGVISDEMKDIIKPSINNTSIKYIGWLEAEKVYDYFLASDLGVFPGTHSVLWEQAVGSGLPCIFKYWDGMNHVDVGGNCIFLKSNDTKELIDSIEGIIEFGSYNKMKKIAVENGITAFSYEEIAKRSIDMN